MDEIQGQVLQTDNRAARSTMARAIGLGFLGGLAGTLVMDLALAGVFSLVGLPTTLIFSFIGETATIFFSKVGILLAGGVPLGMVIHYLIGPALGVLFGTAAYRFSALRISSLPKGALLGILYIEIISQPILMTAPLLREMTASETFQWFGLSFFMHSICGAVLGLVVTHGLRSADAKQRRSLTNTY